MCYILSSKIPVPCEDLLTWAQWIEAHDRERIVRQDIVGSYFVSTVFLGLDHCWRLPGVPRLSETMIFQDGAAPRWS